MLRDRKNGRIVYVVNWDDRDVGGSVRTENFHLIPCF